MERRVPGKHLEFLDSQGEVLIERLQCLGGQGYGAFSDVFLQLVLDCPHRNVRCSKSKESDYQKPQSNLKEYSHAISPFILVFLNSLNWISLNLAMQPVMELSMQRRGICWLAFTSSFFMGS